MEGHSCPCQLLSCLERGEEANNIGANKISATGRCGLYWRRGESEGATRGYLESKPLDALHEINGEKNPAAETST